MTTSTPLLDRFRAWYDHERDCDAKVIAMLESVPRDRRASPGFLRALTKATHIVAARHMWLHRLGVCADRPVDWFPPTTLEAFPAVTRKVEQLWTAYLAGLTEQDVLADVEWIGIDGKRRRYPLVDLLTQLHTHGFYHRGQVALLVKDAGGEPVNADYIFWAKPALAEEVSASGS